MIDSFSSQEPFLSDASGSRTEELMILRMREADWHTARLNRTGSFGDWFWTDSVLMLWARVNRRLQSRAIIANEVITSSAKELVNRFRQPVYWIKLSERTGSRRRTELPITTGDPKTDATGSWLENESMFRSLSGSVQSVYCLSKWITPGYWFIWTQRECQPC